MDKARRVLLTIVLACVLAGGSMRVIAAGNEEERQTDGASDRQDGQEIPPTYDLVAENDLFQLYVDSTTLAFKILDKRSGYIWNSNLDEVAEGDKLNKTWKAFAQSGISLEYLDAKAVNKRISITNSNTSIVISPVENGIRATVSFIDVSIQLDVVLTLESEGVRIEIPFESIQQNSTDYLLGSLYVYPFSVLQETMMYPAICSFQTVWAV